MSTRVSGVVLPNKRIVIALTYIYGIGKTRSMEILDDLSIDYDIRADDLKEDQVSSIISKLSEVLHEGDLRRLIQSNINILKTVSCYRGYRHSRNLPCNGQKTKVNARTRRKTKRVAIANKKK